MFFFYTIFHQTSHSRSLATIKVSFMAEYIKVGVNPLVTNVLQSNTGTLIHTRTTTHGSNDRP